jgi:predicted GNAT family acetyltransferase
MFMYPKLSDFNPDELVYMADEHDDEAFALALSGHAAMKKEPGFYEILTGINDPFANMAFGMNVPDAENRVRAITNRLKELSVPGYFWVGPCTKPDNLFDLLIQNGWKHLATPPAMVADLANLADPKLPEGFSLRRVRTSDDLAVWQDAVARGFKLPIEVAQMFSPLLSDSMRFYTAYLDEQVVGTTALIIHKDVPGIYCVSTFPEFRGQGIGTAMTTLPLLEARREGYQMGTLQASTMGYPIYRRLGFFEVCGIQMFGFGLP